MQDAIKQLITESIAAKQKVLAHLVPLIEETANTLITAVKNGNKLFTCGNGGSAADAQHFAAEFLCRFEGDRKPLAAIALSTDTSTLTAIGNDYSYEDVFARQITALGNKGDVLVAITTSGNSPNILKAVEAAQKKGMHVIGLTGLGGGKLKGLPIKNVIVPSESTARVQESHIMIIHIWCRLIDDAMKQ
jgi:phosphoheptose isomerase